jgi:hypothetical protein
LKEIEAEFDKHVSIKDMTQHMEVDADGIQYIYNYWKLKRKVGVIFMLIMVLCVVASMIRGLRRCCECKP